MRDEVVEEDAAVAEDKEADAAVNNKTLATAFRKIKGDAQKKESWTLDP